MSAAPTPAPPPNPPPKGVVGAQVFARAVSISNDARKCFGAQHPNTYCSGTVISSDFRIGKGAGKRRQWYITARYDFPNGTKQVQLNAMSMWLPGALPTGAVQYPPPPPPPPPPAGPPVVPPPAPAAGIGQPPAVPAALPAADSPPEMPPLPGGDVTMLNAAAAAPAAGTGTATDTGGIGAGIGTGTGTGTGSGLSNRAAVRGPPADKQPVAECHGVSWYEVDDDIDIGTRTRDLQWYFTNQFGDKVFPGTAAARTMTKLDFWMLSMSQKQWALQFRLTNEALSAKGIAQMTHGEHMKWWGITLEMTRHEFSSRHDLWSTTPRSGCREAPNFGKKTGMSRNRWDAIWLNYWFSYQPPVKPAGMSEADYRWMLVDDNIKNFNEHRAKTYFPSDKICGDESVSRWYGLGGNWIDVGLPMYVAIDRKPENGGEIQNICDGKSGVMMQLKVVKAADPDAPSNGHLHGTNVLVELLQPWHNTLRRLVCADSYFASFDCAETLEELNFSFSGPVKNSTTSFPMGHLRNLVADGRGYHKTFACYNEDGSIKFLAVMWVDRDRRYFIVTDGSTKPGTVIERTRWRQFNDADEAFQMIPPEFRVGNAAQTQTLTNQPEAIEWYYDICSLIDRHNRSRQDNLKLERKVLTKDWSKRFNLTVVGVYTVDAWKTFDACQKEWANERSLTEAEFYDQLIDEMIFNDIDTRGLRSSPTAAAAARAQATIPRQVVTTAKKKTKDGKELPFAAQRSCKECKKRTTKVCSLCLDTENKLAYHCDAERTKNACFFNHVADCHPTHASQMN